MNININKTGQSVEVSFDELPQTSQDFIVTYGLRQILNDCHSSLVRAKFEGTDEQFAEAVMDAVEEKLGALLSGDITTRKAGARLPADPLMAEAVKIAREEVKKALAKKGFTIKAVGKDKFNELVDGHIENDGERIKKEAKKRLDNAQEVAIDLSELGIE